MQDVQWDDLRIFLAIARAGSLVAAAGSLEVDHTTLSRRLMNLEDKLGIKLFERAGRRLKINNSGKLLRKTAERMESNLLSDIGTIQSAASSQEGTVRVGAPEGLGIAYLAERLSLITDKHPGISIELTALPQRYSLSAREADIVITLDRPKSGNMVVRKLTDYTLGFYATRPYLEKFGTPKKVEDLLTDHRLSGYIKSLLHTSELDYLKFGSVELVAQLTSTSIIAQRDIVLAGGFICVLPTFVAYPYRKQLVPVLKHENLSRNYWLTIHDDFRNFERIKLVSEALMNIVRDDRNIFKGQKISD